jgi:hypothetical protein
MPVCQGCGASYDDDLAYCLHCGRENPKAFKTRSEPVYDKTTCPICHKDDKIEKVTEIRRYQIQDINGSMPVSNTYTDSDGKVTSFTNRASYHGTQATNLAKALTPPTKPTSPTLHGCFTWLWLIFNFVYLFLGFFGVCGCSNSLLLSSDSFSYGGENTVGFSIFSVIIIIIIGLGYLGFGVLLFILWKKTYNIENSKFPGNQELYNQKMIKWEKAIQKWNLLYYCYRDGSLFIPGKKNSSTVDKMLDFIYQEEIN